MSDDDGAAGARALIVAFERGEVPPEARDDIDTASLMRRFPHLRSVVIEPVGIDGPWGVPVPARAYSNGAPVTVGLVWVHGGAFIGGDLDMPEAHWVAMEFAARGIPVVTLDYQKALNGVHHPVPSDEVLAGWLAALRHPVLAGAAVHLGGASAGANVTAGVTARLRDSGGPSPVSLLQVYPLVHAELPEASAEAAEAAATLPPEARFLPGMVRTINENYVGRMTGLDDPVAFPGTGDLAGFPPVIIVNAEADDLRASGERFAEQLTAAGAPVTMEFEPGTSHGYLDRPELPAATRTIERLVQWMREFRLD
ncbi:alpha/beta hydrolase fold domain-containing protein [Herbiconiux sp. 11R-BC]|uniref:alpha/beta hydrolase n=1 Tax=Herbiconiux sp. 11R-BC TaxID=3111637 RepID=UPI003C01BB4F